MLARAFNFFKFLQFNLLAYPHYLCYNIGIKEKGGNIT